MDIVHADSSHRSAESKDTAAIRGVDGWTTAFNSPRTNPRFCWFTSTSTVSSSITNGTKIAFPAPCSSSELRPVFVTAIIMSFSILICILLGKTITCRTSPAAANHASTGSLVDELLSAINRFAPAGIFRRYGAQSHGQPPQHAPGELDRRGVTAKRIANSRSSRSVSRRSRRFQSRNCLSLRDILRNLF